MSTHSLRERALISGLSRTRFATSKRRRSGRRRFRTRFTGRIAEAKNLDRNP